jgi:hypothetical protein
MAETWGSRMDAWDPLEDDTETQRRDVSI